MESVSRTPTNSGRNLRSFGTPVVACNGAPLLSQHSTNQRAIYPTVHLSKTGSQGVSLHCARTAPYF